MFSGWTLESKRKLVDVLCSFLPLQWEEVASHRWVCPSMAFSPTPGSGGHCVLVSSSLTMPCHSLSCSYHRFCQNEWESYEWEFLCVSLPAAPVWRGRGVRKCQNLSWSLGCHLRLRGNAGRPHAPQSQIRSPQHCRSPRKECSLWRRLCKLSNTWEKEQESITCASDAFWKVVLRVGMEFKWCWFNY